MSPSLAANHSSVSPDAPRIIVLDDDPTGNQTVHGCLLLTRWDEASLRVAFDDESPLFFILTNIRSLTKTDAAKRLTDVCRALRPFIAGSSPILVSRSDSTLRGHYPLDVDIIERELGPFDGHCLVPAFLEGGRVTRRGVHYVVDSDSATPAHETEFARDPVFGYSSSYLPAWVAEKSRGIISEAEVRVVGLPEIRNGDSAGLLSRFGSYKAYAVDAESQTDLEKFADGIAVARERGARVLIRSGAGLLTALVKLPPQPVLSTDMGRFRVEGAPGVILAGSFVPRTSKQLVHLLGSSLPTQAIEIDSGGSDSDLHSTVAARSVASAAIDEITDALRRGRHAVVYTDRKERRFGTDEEQLRFGERIQESIIEMARMLPIPTGFLIGKGGITSHNILSQGLSLTSSRVLGQIAPGVSVVRCPDSHRSAGLPFAIFPGNVGGTSTLTDVVRIIASEPDRH